MSSTPIWVIGDVQGCYQSLLNLLAHPTIQADSHAHFCFAGDLINRGPQSLACLRLAQSLGDRATVILGNHDLHLLGVVAGGRKLNKLDTLDDILSAPDADELITWLRHRPLAVTLHEHLIVHAGVAPSWTLQNTLQYADEVSMLLQAPDWQHTLPQLFGNSPDRWQDTLTGNDRLRVIINTLTRMRTCYLDGRMNLHYKYQPTQQDGEIAWFNLPNRQLTTPVVFGHWSTLGLYSSHQATCLDTGCIWDGKLTAMRLNDHTIVQTDNADRALAPA